MVTSLGMDISSLLSRLDYDLLLFHGGFVGQFKGLVYFFQSEVESDVFNKEADLTDAYFGLGAARASCVW